MEQQANVVVDSPEVSLGPDTCNVCQCDFSLEEEGGASGSLGIIPVSFCPTCHAGLYHMYTAWYGEDEEGGVVLIDEDSEDGAK